MTGLHPVVDLNRMTLLEIEDVYPGEQPEVTGEYLPALIVLPPLGVAAAAG